MKWHSCFGVQAGMISYSFTGKYVAGLDFQQQKQRETTHEVQKNPKQEVNLRLGNGFLNSMLLPSSHHIGALFK
jgi:hypothetical protein